MGSPPEFWAYLLSNALVLVLGGLLAGLSGAAYRRSGRRSLAVASAGFGLVTLGSVVEALYELGIRQSFALSERELLALHAVEGVVIACGLAVLFYSLRNY
ncbi:hypothetical protein SAMN05216559_4048 [Halomicrobium zhouii]|uniref:Uncharacterized protein n=1 Tax=Halomicrobium zhouii TaxID=767519 RepID=A0A1I6M934_9EURY|nr:hypothetical protein [Halomicrobium zhouii]SFS12240.1 hypothetical protein SAMN05216559_4048 [Halomicrobium zhouii]